MEKYLPSLISLIGVFITVGVSFWLGMAKQRTDNKTADKSAESGFRDDLLERNESLTKQIEYKDTQIAARDNIIDKLRQQLLDQYAAQVSDRDKIAELNIVVRELKSEVKELRAELDKFNKKVYLVKQDDSQESSGDQ